jgi:fermentation-respiration switch protein FrsA (DUF1100 family)
VTEEADRQGRAWRLRALLAVLALQRVPFWERSRGRRCGRLVVWALYCYLGVLVVLLALENWFLFHPTKASADWLPPPAGLDVRDVELSSADGTRLHAWWSTPPGWEPGRGAVLYCHGNAGNLSHRGEALRLWAKEMGQAVLIFDYPGYGRSAGRPTEAGCYAAGEAGYAWLTEVQKVRPADVILYGGSLGGAIATELASHRPFRALVLMAAFTSFADMAQKTFPWLPARWLVRNKLDNVTKIALCRGPVFIAHGTADGLVPFTHGERLYAAACGPKRFYPMVGHDHNDGAGPEFFAALRQFLAEVR